MTLLPLLLMSLASTAYGAGLETNSCSKPPITNPDQAIFWGKYHVIRTWKEFKISNMKVEVKLQNSVWSVGFSPANPGILGGGAIASIRSDNGELLELWRTQ